MKQTPKNTRKPRTPKKRPITTKKGGRNHAKSPSRPRAIKKTNAASAGAAANPKTRATRRPPSAAAGDLGMLFPRGLGPQQKRFGVGVFLAVAERQGRSAEIRYARVEKFFAKPARQPKTEFLEKHDPNHVAGLLAGLAHPDRVRVARAVMTGKNTHRLLSEAVGLRTGPLYHHIRALERSGLLVIVGRNRYDLTQVGRTVLLVTTVLATCQAERPSPWRIRRFSGKRP